MWLWVSTSLNGFFLVFDSNFDAAASVTERQLGVAFSPLVLLMIILPITKTDNTPIRGELINSTVRSDYLWARYL